MEKESKRYTVYGKLTDADGHEIADASVMVWWQRIRESLPVANGKTNEAGDYRMEFSLPGNAPGSRLVVVEARSERLQLPVRSNPVEPAEDLLVNLQAKVEDDSTFGTFIRRMKPLMDNLSFEEITETAQHQDISFLARELKQTPEQIMQVIVAERIGKMFKIPAAAFFAFLKLNTPSALPSPLLDASDQFTMIDPLTQRIASMIFQLSAESQKHTLTSAVALDLIGKQFSGQITDIVSALQTHRSDDMLQHSYIVGSTTLGEILSSASIPAAKQTVFAQALTSNSGSMRKFWKNLGSGQIGLTEQEASTIERTISIGSFVKNYVPLITNLMGGFNKGTYKNLSDLAKLSREDWTAILKETSVPKGIDPAGNASPAEVFASVIYTRIARAYPTVALAARISKSKVLPPVIQRPLLQFFSNNPSLELVKDNLPVYLSKQGAAAFTNIDKKDQAVVVTKARSLQRVLRVAPDPDISETLVSMGMNSAYDIAKTGEQQFFIKATAAGLSKPEANKVYRAAAQRHASVVSLYMKLNIDAMGLLPQAMGGGTDLNQITQRGVAQDPSLTTLFGSQDYCETDDCTSVLSPAAYLCDLLLWLRKHPQGGRTALDVLDDRRPDIRHLLLNCPNSETEMVFEDLVIELLTDSISPAFDSISTTYTQKSLANGTAYFYVVTAVNAAGEGAASAEVTATPAQPVAVPAAPVAPVITPGNGKAKISWTAVAGATSYNIYWGTAPGVTTATGTKIAVSGTDYLQTGLTNGTTYYYILTAINEIGEGPASAESNSAPVVPVAVPAAPAGLTLQPGDGLVRIIWNDVPGADSYNIYWANTTGVTATTGTKIPGATAPFMQEALVDGTSYFYIVTAVNAIGESLPSAEASTNPLYPVAAPAAPTGVTASAFNGQVTLNWNPVAGATSYNIYWGIVTGVTVKNGNEITGSLNPKWKQTSADLTAAQLRAAPEYFNQGAWDLIAAANYPQTMPYSAGLDALRIYLNQFKLPLWQLRQALLPLAGGTPSQRLSVAAERFGMSKLYSDITTNPDFITRNTAWNTGASDPVNALVPVSPPASNPSQLSFITAAAITYHQLLELLQVSWVQGGLGVSITGVNDLCMTSDESLSPAPLDPKFLDRAHRFLKLWISTGYKMIELDQLLQNVLIGAGVLDGAAVTNIFSFRDLQDQTKLTFNQLISFFQNLDSSVRRDATGEIITSFYQQVFLNPSVSSIAPDADLVAIGSGGVPVDPVLSNHLPAIQAALGITTDDAYTLFSVTDNTLTLANLSLIYRVSILAKLTRLQMPQLLRIALLLNPPAANFTVAVNAIFASLQATAQFLSQITALQQSGITTDALIYLMTPPASTTLAVAMAVGDSSITVANNSWFPASNFYIQIGAEILLVTAVTGTQNNQWTVTRGQLGTVAAAAILGATVLATAGWATSAQMTQTDIASTLGLIQQAVQTLLAANTTLAAAITAAQTSFDVKSNLGFPAPPFYVAVGAEVMLVTAVAGPGNVTWTVTRGQLGTVAAAAAAAAAVTPTGGDVNGSVVSVMAATAHNPASTGINNDVAAYQLNNLKVPGTGTTLITSLTDTAFINFTGTLTAANFPQQFLAVSLFDKSAIIVRSTKLVLTDLSWLFVNAAVYQGVDFTALPITTAQPAQNLNSLLNTILLVKLARLWTSALPTSPVQKLYDIISGVSTGALADESQVQAALAIITGWQQADIKLFASTIGAVYPLSYTAPSTFDALRRLGAMVTLTGTNAAQLVNWAAAPADEATAQGMASGALSALKATQPSTEAWLAFAPPFVNVIRDHRSSTLQSYMVGLRDSSGKLIYGDVNQLFNHFLIDVQMSSCQVTSRVVQAYIAVQIFVERCIMNLEAPAVVVNQAIDDTWSEWQWMKRYRIWEANREVFLYPENWLIESQRPNRTENFQKLEQEVHQGQSTRDYLEGVVMNYIDRLDALAHLVVTGTCEDPVTGNIYVVARSVADPPVFYIRSYISGNWSGWSQITLNIHAHQVVPAVYRGRLCIFWIEIKTANEPSTQVGSPQTSSDPASTQINKYVSIGVNFSIFWNGKWNPAQSAKGKLFDKPVLDSNTQQIDSLSIESLYTLKIETQSASSTGYGSSLFLDVFRLGEFSIFEFIVDIATSVDLSKAIHLGRAIFDGRFNDLELSDTLVPVLYPSSGPFFGAAAFPLLEHAVETYGPDAQPLLPLTSPDPPLVGDSALTPQAGALAGFPSPSGGTPQSIQLNFTSAGALEQNVGPLLNRALLPLRVVGPSANLNFDPASYFFYQDNRRAYFVESPKYYWTGSFFSPAVPSDPGDVAYEILYSFHPFYHPFTRLFWHQLSSGGFNLLYDANLQANPDQVDPTGSDLFSFNSTYQPTSRVTWDHDDVTGQDRQFLDFRYSAPFSVYNWELFYHIPQYVASLLNQNQQFEDAQAWYHYIFNPTRQTTDPSPQRFWITKPLHNLTPAQILAQQINNLLLAVNQGNVDDINQIESWRKQPFNPFLLADQRNVAYMKSTVMSYIDNLVNWADNLFATESREALAEATLIYVIADEILGPKPIAVTPPKHADQSYDQLEPHLDAFANAMVEIENVIGGAGGSGGSGGTTTGSGGGVIPGFETFYFKIPSNPTLLQKWTTVEDRLNKLRHCQNIAGQPLVLALFDAPIDPGLLIRAQAAGVDFSSVLSDLGAPLPNYRFTALYAQASDFVNAVRAYGTALQGALEKSDGDQLAMLTATNQLQLLQAADQIFQWQIDQQQKNIDGLVASLAIAQAKYDFNTSQDYASAAEITGTTLHAAAGVLKIIVAALQMVSAGTHLAPQFTAGVAGIGGSPLATLSDGGENFGKAPHRAGLSLTSLADVLEVGAGLSNTIGTWQRRNDNWVETAKETSHQIDQINAQIDAAGIMMMINQQNLVNHQLQDDQTQNQIDFLTNKFSNQDLYDWMSGMLAETYFKSYQLAYQMCKQVERCYQFELGVQNSSFIQFGYWDSLYKGLLAGENLNQDLRRMQASYLQLNARRFEISRFVSLASIDAKALQQLIVTGACDFTLPESLFDNDYPGHFNRRLTRVSVTVVYPNPGKFDNVKASLTLVTNKVRISTDASAGYAENPVGTDPRFIYNYGAVPQKIVLGNAQDDPGLFITAIASNIADQRYLPFENSGAVSSWHFDMQQASNEVDLSTVGDVVLHLYYTAIDGGDNFRQVVAADTANNLPTTGAKVFSALNDFAAPAATAANPYPVSPWQAFLSPSGGGNQLLTLSISPLKFPAWTRGKTISATSLTLLTVGWQGGNFVVVPQGPLPTAPVVMNPVAGVTEPNVCSANIALPANTALGTWSFELQLQGAADFKSLTKNQIGDLIIVVNFSAT